MNKGFEILRKWFLGKELTPQEIEHLAQLEVRDYLIEKEENQR